MNWPGRAAVLAAVLAMVACLSSPAVAAPSWSALNIQSPPGSAFFSTITCLSTTDCWSPGYSNVTQRGITDPVMEHWDGNKWSLVSTPVAGAELGRVDCTGAADCWSAGYVEASTGQTGPVVEHWDGVSWSKVLLPALTGDRHEDLDSVTCLSSSECFALGGAGAGETTPFSPLVFHFDGARWSVMAKVAVPKGYKSADLEQMRCTSATSCVAEGVEIPEGSYFDHVYSQTFNGSKWTVAQMPQPYNLQFSSSYAPDLSCPSPSQCVAPVNAAPDANGKTVFTPFLEVWDGGPWKLLSTPPALVKSFGDFTDVACLAEDNCWTTMAANTGGVVAQWRGGQSWTVGSAPSTAGSSFDAVACLPGEACYLVGATDKGMALADRLLVPGAA